METKSAITSLTLWINALMPVLYILVPGLSEVLSAEAAVGIVALVNGVIRVVKTNKGIGSVV